MLKSRKLPGLNAARSVLTMCLLFGGAPSFVEGASAQPAPASSAAFSIVAGPQSGALAEAITSAIRAKDRSVSVTTAIASTADTAMSFCASMQADSPAVILTSRKLTGSEIERCIEGGVTELSEAQLGFLALLLVQKASDPVLRLSNHEIYRALALEVPNEMTFIPNAMTTWRDVHPSMPATKIHFLTTSRANGSRRVFEAQALVGGCRSSREIKLIFSSAYRIAKCTTMRSNVVTEIDDTLKRVEALRVSGPGTIALLTSDVYVQNSSWMRIIPINGFEPSREAIHSDDYTLATPIFLYAKKRYQGSAGSTKEQDPTLRLWLNEALSDRAIGPGGYLEQLGLIAMPTATRGSQRSELTSD